MSTTFAFVTFAWIFFRADGMHFALGYIKQIGVSIIEHPGQFLLLPGGKMAFTYIIPLLIGDWYLRRDERVLKTNLIAQIIIFWFVVLYSFGDKSVTFIYFQF